MSFLLLAANPWLRPKMPTFMEKYGKFLAWDGVETLEESEKVTIGLAKCFKCYVFHVFLQNKFPEIG